MRNIKRGLIAMLVIAGAILLHYSLPGREIVRIAGQEVKRQDAETVAADGTVSTSTRDVNFVYVVDRDGNEHAYRNEDTDWGWPPYFKFDTADVSAKAANLASTEEAPRWVEVTHYGWRLRMVSMFPNIVDIEPAGDATEPPFPWFNLVIGLLYATGALALYLWVRRAYDRHVDPLLDAAGDKIDTASEAVSAKYKGISGWIRKMTGK